MDAPRVTPDPSGSRAGDEVALLRAQVSDLQAAKQRLSRLYFGQLEMNRKRSTQLRLVLENVCQMNAEQDLDSLLRRFAETVRETLGFRVVVVRTREVESNRLVVRASAGLDEAERDRVAATPIGVPEFLSWLREEFRVSRSYFISHAHELARAVPKGYRTASSARQEWEWHPDDVLLVPLFNRTGELLACLSVDDPGDRLVPSREAVELLEIFGNHAVVAIENTRLYHQLERYALELEAAGKHLQEIHALKSNFVSAVSHELRTPLTAIRAYVDTLIGAREGELTQDRLHHFLGIINDESQRLARLIESVLDLSRFDAPGTGLSRQPVDLAELVEETRRILEPVAQVGQVGLKVSVECADTGLDANRDQLRQLAIHLGGNAVKFTPAGGQVTFRLTGDERQVTLRVEDTGIGVPEEALEKIFERFYQVDSSLVRRYGGTGLGLAICKSIVDAHDGSIFAESTLGHGSCFTVTLQRRPEARVILRPAPQAQPASEDVFRLAIEMVADVMGARVVSLLCPDADGTLVIRAAMGLDARVVREARIQPGEGVAGWVAEHRRPVCVSGPDEPDGVRGSGRALYRSRTFLSVPLETDQGLLGVLNVTDPVSEQPFDAESCHLLLHLADRVAAAWEQTLGLEQSQAGVEGTARALRQVMRHLDRGRSSAPDRVKLARGVARELGLGESEVGVVSFAASVHDVGMHRVGDQILGKEEPLTEEEQALMRRHPDLSAQVLGPLDVVGVVREVVVSHHEWWDGSGYPRGLAGTEIPIGGRILAVVDAYESMTVGRAHRPTRSREEALEELRRRGGTQFDPRVVEAFERALSQIERTESSGVLATESRR